MTSRYRQFAINTLKHHERKGFLVKIPIDYLESLARKTKSCVYCGVDLDWHNRTKNIAPNNPTLDRVNNDLVLTPNNVAIVCHRCNEAKGNLSLREFFKLCKSVVAELGDA